MGTGGLWWDTHGPHAQRLFSLSQSRSFLAKQEEIYLDGQKKNRVERQVKIYWNNLY